MSFSSLPNFRFETSEVRPADRHDLWQDVLGGVCDVSPTERNGPADCMVNTEAWYLGGMIAIDLQVNAQSHARTARHVRADQVDHYRLTLKVQGLQSCDLGGQVVALHRGDMLLVDQAAPECSHFHGAHGHNLVFFIPRDTLDEALPAPMSVHGASPRGAAASLLAEHLTSVMRHLPQMTPEDAPDVTAATVHLLSAALKATPDSLGLARPVIESSLLRQACRYIDLHLGEESLSATTVATFFKISRATLYRLFEPHGGVAGYIKERRLLRIHAMLSGPGHSVRLQEIAEDHGFKTVPHLCREFRQLFGYAPSDARGQRTTAPRSEIARLRDAAFYTWMRTMKG